MTNSTVTHEDCMALMARYPDKYFELAVVDPPFGLGEKLTNGGTWAAKYSKADSVWDKAPESNYFQQLLRVSKNQIIWGGNYFALPSTRCFLIWDKVAHMDTLADCEFAWTSFDRNAKIFKHVRNTSESRIHICQKPVKLYDWIFKNYANEGDKILDTHLGSGSSRISAWKAGLDFTACELDADYFAAQEKRFKEFTAQMRLF